MRPSRPAVLILLLAVAGFAGCVAGPAADGEGVPVRVVVATGFGREVLLDRTTHVPAGASALEAVGAVADVETGFGGGYVTRIAGHEADGQRAWFYAVDGLHPDVGAGQRAVASDAVVRWDLHRWDHLIDAGGTLADWPRPFAGTTPAVVGPDRVVEMLDGRQVATPPADPVAVVGAWNASVFAPVNRDPHAHGLLVHPGEPFVVHDPAGRRVDPPAPVRAHVALVPSPWGDADDPALIVQGRTQDDAVAAVSAFRAADAPAHAHLLVGDTLRGVPS